MSDSPDDLRSLKVGQAVSCRIFRKEHDGYAVHLRDHLAFLHTKHQLHTGDEVTATVIRIGDPVVLAGEDVFSEHFVCKHNHRLVSARFSNNVSKIASTPNVRWEEYLDEIDQNPK